MSEKIEKFLEAEDLDELLSNRNKLGNLEEKDIILIRSILQEWQNPQAVSNLLFYPSVIPEDMRINYLIKGLTDRENFYNILAATVGLQEIDYEQLLNEEIVQIRERLLEIIETDETVLADRASVSILPFLGKQDVDRVFRLLSHPSKVTRHNILGWLYKTIVPDSPEQFIEAAAVYNLPSETITEVSEVLQEHEQRVANGLLSYLTFPIFSYIPNLQ